MGNRLEQLPDSFGDLAGLYRLGLKSNALRQLPGSFTRLTGLVELFITDNKLTELPEGAGLPSRERAAFCGVGELWPAEAAARLWLTAPWLACPQWPAAHQRRSPPSLPSARAPPSPSPARPPPGFGALASLVKLQASFNPWAKLPADVLNLPRLELFRLAAGDLPDWPRPAPGSPGAPGLPPSLAWCSLGGNPAAAPLPPIGELPLIDLSEVEVDRATPLGEGASGECFRGGLPGSFPAGVGGWPGTACPAFSSGPLCHKARAGTAARQTTKSRRPRLAGAWPRPKRRAAP
jgi:hypothetical protein